MEGGLLSDKQLAKQYDRVVWLYLFQDFSGSEADRAAERVAVRFGISSWPQHLLIDPKDLSIVGDTGRQLDSFGRAIDRVQLQGKLSPSPKELAELDAQADALMTSKGLKLARKHLDSQDLVLRYFAAKRLADEKPSLLTPHAARLLKTQHDQLRFLLCRVLAEHGAALKTDAAELSKSLAALLEDPQGSRNPNRLRGALAQALETCGTREALKSLAPFASSGQALNMLTKTSATAVAAIGERDRKARAEAIAILLRSFPAPPPSGTGRRAQSRARYFVGLAELVHAGLERATGQRFAFPSRYTAETREALLKRWKAIAARLGS